MANEIIKTQLHPQKPADESDIIYPETSVDQVKGLPVISGSVKQTVVVNNEGYSTAPYNEPTKVRVGETQTLPEGYPASVQNVGTPEAPVLNFQIPQGKTGPQGPRGEKGDKGDKGGVPAVGMHHIQFSGESTPAEIWAGTSWEIDTNYQGRTIIGSGGSYTFGVMGGSETHINAIGTPGDTNAVALIQFNQYSVGLGIGLTAADYPSGFTPSEALLVSGTINGTAEYGVRSGVTQVVGTTREASNMQPYTVVNFWKRTA